MLELPKSEESRMPRTISEADWKIFRELQRTALERFCQGVLSEIDQISSNSGKSAHERYLAIFKLLESRDDTIAEAFNDLRRSTALHQLRAHSVSQTAD